MCQGSQKKELKSRKKLTFAMLPWLKSDLDIHNKPHYSLDPSEVKQAGFFK